MIGNAVGRRAHLHDLGDHVLHAVLAVGSLGVAEGELACIVYATLQSVPALNLLQRTSAQLQRRTVHNRAMWQQVATSTDQLRAISQGLEQKRTSDHDVEHDAAAPHVGAGAVEEVVHQRLGRCVGQRAQRALRIAVDLWSGSTRD